MSHGAKLDDVANVVSNFAHMRNTTKHCRATLSSQDVRHSATLGGVTLYMLAVQAICCTAVRAHADKFERDMLVICAMACH